MVIPTYSISVRLRRTVHETLHVLVPVTDEVMVEEPDGTAHLDGKKVFAAAVELGRGDQHVWVVDGDPVIEIHPIQGPPPPAEKT